MSSRRSFLGAAAAALSLPATVSGEADPDASTPGDTDPGHPRPRPSTSSPAPIAARVKPNPDGGSIHVGSIQFTGPETPTYEAEVVLSSRPLRLGFTADGEAARQLRDILQGDRPDGHVGGTVEMFTDTAPVAEGTVSVLGERLRVEAGGVEVVATLDEETRADVAEGLDAALVDAATLEQ